MITLNSFAKDIVNLIKPNLTTNWSISSDLGELTENKDLLAYFSVTNAVPIIYNNATLRCDCELIGTLLFEQRTVEEAESLTNDLYDAALTTIKSI